MHIRSQTLLLQRLALSHLFLLSPLPAQLSVGRRHRLDHKRGGHVAGERKEHSRYESSPFRAISVANKSFPFTVTCSGIRSISSRRVQKNIWFVLSCWFHPVMKGQQTRSAFNYMALKIKTNPTVNHLDLLTLTFHFFNYPKEENLLPGFHI